MQTSSRKNKSGRKAAFPLAENELHSDFLKLRQEMMLTYFLSARTL